MNNSRLVFLAVALAVPVIGCGSSEDVFVSGGASSGAGGTSGSGGSGGGDAGSGGSGGGDAGSGGGCDPQSCTEPPPDACADGSTVITYESQGACSDGSCKYPSSSITCDAPPPPACKDDGSLRTYSSIGTCADGACSYEPMDADCGAAGCCEDHCCELDPSNSDTLGQLEQTGLVISAPQGTFDTSTGCITPSVLGNCKVVAQAAGAPEVCVCRADELTINSLTIAGKRALAIFASRSVTVGEIIVKPGAGIGWIYQNIDGTSARGGSYGTTGGNAGALTQGTPAIVPLTGGMNGQNSYDKGGYGGGAIQISAGQMITIETGINAGGEGGRPGIGLGGSSGGAGGGSGGAILLEAPSIIMKGTLSANGGGGGGGSSNQHGTGTSGLAGGGTTAASGGSGLDGWGCALNGYTSGGDGGQGSKGDGNGQWGQDGSTIYGCLGGTESVGMGGGGGGAGRIRINTLNGCTCSGVTSPSASIGTVVLK